MKFIASLVVALVAADAVAWMDGWAPEFECEQANVRRLSAACVSNFYEKAKMEVGCAEYTVGCALDLNADGYYDFVYIIPWMGCGLNASGYEVNFLVSNGTKGMTESAVDGYGVGTNDLVTVNGKTYFRQSKFFGDLENSKHNHWVYQVYSFDKSGTMKCANSDFGDKFPAATIFYDKPKFKRVSLTPEDLELIKKDSTPIRTAR